MGLTLMCLTKTCNKFVFTGNRVYLFRKKLLDRSAFKLCVVFTSSDDAFKVIYCKNQLIEIWVI